MSVNRNSDLNTSLSRTDGVHVSYLNLSSADRDKNVYPTSEDSELSFDAQSNVIGMEIANFEIPHTRYAIDKDNNTFYISEKWGEDQYYFYGLRASTGGYTIQNLAVTLELSAKCPVMYNGDVTMGNTYNFVAAPTFGRVGIISSGDYEYTLHNATETATVSSIVKSSDTEASIVSLSSSEYTYKPGAILLFKPHTYTDREVQVMETTDKRTVRVIGDFSDLDISTLDVSLSTMVPYSATSSVSRVMGAGDVDLTGHSDFEVLAMGSPFSGEDILEDASIMVAIDFPLFSSPGDYVKLTGVSGFMNDTIFEVSTTHDDTHIELFVNRDSLFTSTTGGVMVLSSDSSTNWSVTSTSISAISNNLVDVVVTTSSSTSLSVGDSVFMSGFDAEELKGLTMVVSSVSSSSNDVILQFTYPTTNLFSTDGTTRLAPVDTDTGILTTYITPFRFDLSRGRRMVLCRAIIDNQDVGSIHIPALSSRNFFGRIQLFSGADLVNFLGPDTAVGTHEFNSVLKRLNRIRFQFFNEDGTPYDFIGVDYTIFIKLTKLDSNTGI